MIEIDVTEVEKLREDLITKAVPQMRTAVRRVTVSELKALQDRAKGLAPRDRPWLATQGIRRKTRSDSTSVSGDVFTVSDPEGRPVGFYVEYGTSKMPPQPFILPAVAPAEQSYPEAISRAIDPLTTTGGGGDIGGDDA